MKKFARHAIFYAGLLAIWALLAKLRVWPPYVFPSPWGVLEALLAGFKDHSFWIAIAVSMKRMLLGYALSVVLGMILGLGVASNKFLEETVGGLLVSLQSLPSICWLPLAVLWFGLTEKAILFVVVMGSLLSVTIAMETGRHQIPKIYKMAGRNLGARRFRLFWHVLLPASLPYVVSGLKQGWAFAWRSHEPGHRRDDSDYCDWLYRRRAGLQDHRTPTAAEVGIDPSHVELGSGPF